MRYLLILFTVTFQGQVLHHEMVSAQGASKKLPDGISVSQTIGQNSNVGTSSFNYVIQQGFQQSFWGKYIASNPPEEIKFNTYPNPFIQTINFEFSKIVSDDIEINVFDISGRLVFNQSKKADNFLLTVLLPFLSRGEYLVRLNTSTFSVYTKIIKL
ncbi:T9SS type A sorting domain-containing protein [Flavobacterium sp. CHNK8]|uniref:T9SS type A sorting domain-containing protein n=1 Tax=Flavobacterium sp. CHNK8 TaxID=2871165 RepID=UPI001C8E1248|nr:T9SS type A sorting domain-containing protein [Flavobacterium sp. CHNK8]QZK90272.1 T9SS type A sorting domain-containing protein [Flavobacterium sp. CHNK8]